MPAIPWNTNMHIGIKDIDDQHEKLTLLINELYYAYMDAKERPLLEGIIQEINEYANYHFKTEKELMDAHQYEQRKSHLAQHDYFTKRAIAALFQYTDQKEELTAELLDWLTDWWMNHINGTDKELGTFLRDRGVC